MPTKTFSSRADSNLLSFADALSRKEYGLSFGQYCGTVLLDAIDRTGHMPYLGEPTPADHPKQRALAFIKGFSKKPHDRAIGELSDQQIRDLIASRYA